MPEAERPDPVLDLIRSVEPPPHDSEALWRRVHSRRAEWAGAGGYRTARNWLRFAAAFFVPLLGLYATVEPIRSAAGSAVVQPVQSWTRAAAERIARIFDPQLPTAVVIPADRMIRVYVDRCQETGILRVVRSDSRSAVLSVSSERGAEHVSPLPGGARVHNSSESTASYRLVVPLEVRHLALRIGRAPVLLDLTSSGATAWDLYLSVPAGEQIGHCSE